MSASNILGQDLPITGIDGRVTVEAAPTPVPTAPAPLAAHESSIARRPWLPEDAI